MSMTLVSSDVDPGRGPAHEATAVVDRVVRKLRREADVVSDVELSGLLMLVAYELAQAYLA